MKQIWQVLFIVLLIAFAAECTNNRVEGSMQEVTYSLRTNFDEYTNDELNASLFHNIIDCFSPDIWDFMVLAPDKPISGSTFIQVGAPEEIVDFKFTLEIGFENLKSGLKIYRLYTDDKSMVLQCFIDYWQEQRIPDISLWEDVSEEMK